MFSDEELEELVKGLPEKEDERYRISMLQYDNLRKHFRALIHEVLGKDYYNMAMDVYECDRQMCRDIAAMCKKKKKRKK